MSATDDLTNQPGHDLDLGIDYHSRREQCSPVGGSVISVPLENQDPGQGHADRFPLGEDVPLELADLRDRLPFDDETFDDVVASLVLHYLQDWGPTLAELRRVLKAGGRLIVSVEHPIIAYMIQEPLPNYLATNAYSFDWTFGGQTAPMTFWRRPLHAMTDAFTAAGFCLSLISEPQPDPAARHMFPDDEFEAMATQPNFVFFVVKAVPLAPVSNP